MALSIVACNEKPVENVENSDDPRQEVNNGMFLSGDPSKVDEGCLGLDVESVDLSNYAYQRWYHREFPLHNDGSTVTLSTFCFAAG